MLSSSLKAYSKLLQDSISLESTLFSCSSSSVIVYCSYCSMIGKLNLRTKIPTRDRGSIVHNHGGKSFLSISSFQYHNYQNAQTFLDVLVAFGRTAPLYIQ